MSWVRLDDRVLDHPKIIGLPATAFRAWIGGLAWSSAQRTGGWLPTAVLPALRASAPDARALVAAGLWERGDGGWQIHDYDDYQRPVSVELAAKRAAAGRQGARARWQANGTGMADDTET